jgi:16S rRNA C967 or C1407 C5-methylase (RsmB/RsmF family)
MSTTTAILERHYEQQGISLSNLNETQRHRFIRLHPRYKKEETLELLRSECREFFYKTNRSAYASNYPMLVPWLDNAWGYYALPGDFSVAQSQCFQSGRIYGQDVNSGAAVAALLTDHYDIDQKLKSSSPRTTLRVLDLCCAPGLKLCVIADWLEANSISAELIGVDNSEPRVNICKRVLKKYQYSSLDSPQQDELTTIHTVPESNIRIQVYCNDGTTFIGDGSTPNLLFDSVVAREELLHCGKRKRINKSAKARQAKHLKQIETETAASIHESKLFDCVLVDAECSTDGSIKHVQKKCHDNPNNQVENEMLTNKDNLDGLVDLQKRLATNGFRLLRPGGLMIYSTCSFSERQNEEVVKWLLDNNSNAQIVPVTFRDALPSDRVAHGSIKGTLRFLPGRSVVYSDDQIAPPMDTLFGDGFYLAKIRKLDPVARS